MIIVKKNNSFVRHSSRKSLQYARNIGDALLQVRPLAAAGPLDARRAKKMNSDNAHPLLRQGAHEVRMTKCAFYPSPKNRDPSLMSSQSGIPHHRPTGARLKFWIEVEWGLIKVTSSGVHAAIRQRFLGGAFHLIGGICSPYAAQNKRVLFECWEKFRFEPIALVFGKGRARRALVRRI